MYGEIVTKRSPIVLLFKFALIEAAGLLLYLGATLLGNAKYLLYARIAPTNVLPYHTARALFLAGAEFALTAYAFLSWYYEDYTIRPAAIIHRHGVFRRRLRTVFTGAGTNLTFYGSPLGTLLHYGSIRVERGGHRMTVRDVSRPERIAKAIQGEFEPSRPAFDRLPPLTELLAQPEHERLEFKSSLRFDHRAGKPSREMEKAAMKTLAAFLNSRGGILVIGVNDERVPLGLDKDYATLQRGDADGFENHLTQTFNSMIGPGYRDLIKLTFHKANDHDVCVVQALASPRPVYLKLDNSEHFYMRTGNISTSLKLSEIEAYSRSRWPVAFS